MIWLVGELRLRVPIYYSMAMLLLLPFFHGFTLQLISRYYYHYFSLLQSTYLLVVPYTALTTRRWRRRRRGLAHRVSLNNAASSRLSSPHGGVACDEPNMMSVSDTVAPWKIGSPFIVEVPAITCR